MTTTSIPVRQRRRNLDLGALVTPPAPTEEMRTMARTVFLENGRMNSHKREHDNIRKKLYAAMSLGKVSKFDMNTTDEEGNDLSLTVLIGRPGSTVIVVENLLAQVFPTVKAAVDALPDADRARFYAMLQTTQTAVVEQCGKIMADATGKMQLGNENVTVAASK